MSHYDIAVVGGGLAGMSVLYHLERAGKLMDKSILLVDPEKKRAHDRTWSFWERGEGPFEHLLHHRWETVDLFNAEKQCTCVLRPYAYKVILSNTFYDYVNGVLDGVAKLERVHGLATPPETVGERAHFMIDGRAVSADVVFSSLPHPLNYREVSEPYLDQHFRGWIIETETDVFDPGRATLMDFRTPQEGETRFFYVLPFSKRRALVEIAIFSNHHLTTEAYDELIGRYIHAHWTKGGYRVEHTEAGNIPMTTYRFPVREGRVVHIGLGGGAARPSTGYTFFGLQRQLMRMAAEYPDVGRVKTWSEKAMLYDATLLRILERQRLAGEELFVDLFRSNPPARVLAFLNGESSLWEELQLMSTTRIGVFGRTFVEEALR